GLGASGAGQARGAPGPGPASARSAPAQEPLQQHPLQAMISTTGLGKSYGARTLFEDVTLQLNPGSRYGLVGANGSGKSTFLRVVAGDEEATAGSFRIDKNARLGVLRQDRFL